ncbi:MAG TPA: ABC transporter ATP-binding protein [Rhodopila sp.]|uniref:ABC transporter ATP-binding protein n=1 Tax=Rhodopila sp. TaxID=2480087 RepID=UPI002C883E80|nr:ABC transporter ATP-binding protein [Rhodopila sp.]HVY14470.1 ABC transporter ATP-binding protein [Rhodopila sp.]
MKADAPPLMQLNALRKTYRLRRTLIERLKGVDRVVTAVDGVSLSIQRGSILGLVGESGCGKSTLAQMLVGLLPPTGGTIEYDGTDMSGLAGDAWLNYRQGVQMVFQDTGSSLNPRKRIRTILREAVAARGLKGDCQDTRVAALMEQVGLDIQLLSRYPHALSGGQRQRVGIARALAMEPSLLLADEPVSSLDVSLQGQIINLLRELNENLGLTIVLISHDLAVVARVCDAIAVMYSGRIVESGTPDQVLTAPRHPYTQALLDAVPRGLERRDRKRTILPVESGPILTGCKFRRRCARAVNACETTDPKLATAGPGGHEAACLMVG